MVKPESGYTGSGITSVKVLRNSVITDITSDICLRTCTDIGIHWFNTGKTSTKRLIIYEAVGNTSSKKLMIFTNFDWNSFKKVLQDCPHWAWKWLNANMDWILQRVHQKTFILGVNVTKHFCPWFTSFCNKLEGACPCQAFPA